MRRIPGFVMAIALLTLPTASAVHKHAKRRAAKPHHAVPVTPARPTPAPGPAPAARAKAPGVPALQAISPAVPHPLATTAVAASTGGKWEDAEFSSAVQEFQQAAAARDRAALRDKVQPAFARIAAGNGRYASLAQHYQSVQVPDLMRKFYRCPQVRVTPAVAGDLSPRYRTGQLVSAPLLDTPTQWLHCAEPDSLTTGATDPRAHGVARVQVLIDETGRVSRVRPREGTDGDAVFKSVAAAVRQWKATPPRWQGKPVKTAVSLDIAFP